ncbi:MAG: rhodanese-like domain-containing protein, partial [Bacteroidia bacterium]|nr:rhodanese-like domain-containing protein [Bacteroidia bacterium]
FEQDIQGLDKSKPVVVYCRSGRRTAKCTKKMIEAGFVKIYDLEGGITQWQHEGFEVKTIEIP